ncbi:CAP domain-containing protein [Streptomyces sp. 8N616]|uniref:CAP domain-containing protein n=1 Tax=Streptomyces sp. 8N616 TaxID=3457414 RepID=UPI003FD1AF62
MDFHTGPQGPLRVRPRLGRGRGGARLRLVVPAAVLAATLGLPSGSAWAASEPPPPAASGDGDDAGARGAPGQPSAPGEAAASGDDLADGIALGPAHEGAGEEPLAAQEAQPPDAPDAEPGAAPSAEPSAESVMEPGGLLSLLMPGAAPPAQPPSASPAESSAAPPGLPGDRPPADHMAAQLSDAAAPDAEPAHQQPDPVGGPSEPNAESSAVVPPWPQGRLPEDPAARPIPGPPAQPQGGERGQRGAQPPAPADAPRKEPAAEPPSAGVEPPREPERRPSARPKLPREHERRPAAKPKSPHKHDRRPSTRPKSPRASQHRAAVRGKTFRKPQRRQRAGTLMKAARQVVRLINARRAAAGCRPLRVSPALSRAATNHADVMARSGMLSHTGPDGSQQTTRAARVGYRGWSVLGENIARGQKSPSQVTQDWMNSPGHRANILNCEFREIGVGVHKGPSGPWWAQNFGARR